MSISRRSLLAAGLAGAALQFNTGRGLASASSTLPSVTSWRNPGCGCCEKWVERMKEAGFAGVTMADDPDLDARRSALGTPAGLAGCHIALIGDYVFEGHVPPADIISFLAAGLDAKGLAVPGMPVGSPGMEMGDAKEPFDVLVFMADGTSHVYARHEDK